MNGVCNPHFCLQGVFFLWILQGELSGFKIKGALTVRGEIIALRKWLPKENSVVNGKFRRGWLELRGLPFHLWVEVQLRYILQKWGKVTKVVRES